MKRYIRQVNCREHFKETRRSSPFILVKYQLDYESDSEDRVLIDTLLDKASALAERVNPKPANAEAAIRQRDTVFANAIAGVVSEYLWKAFLNSEQEVVQETEFNEASSQIDLEIVNSKKRIEVRSSFPRNGISFALCHPEYQFDILGPYANSTYKPGEISKEYYVRTLFEMESPTDILHKIKEDCFCVYLTGGATVSMMKTKGQYEIKSLLPDDAIGATGEAQYRVIPFSRALDTFQIQALITQSAIQN